MRPHPDEGTPPPHRLHPGRLQPGRHEKALPTWFHASAREHDYIYVSAGVRGLQFKLAPQALVDYIGAQYAEIIKL